VRRTSWLLLLSDCPGSSPPEFPPASHGHTIYKVRICEEFRESGKFGSIS
jgi:hypothetical protein